VLQIIKNVIVSQLKTASLMRARSYNAFKENEQGRSVDDLSRELIRVRISTGAKSTEVWNSNS
jgi:hypothetical protein